MLVMEFLKRHFYIFAMVFFFLHTLATQEHYFLNSDVSFLSQLVTNSTQIDFYQHFYEVNPPLIGYLYYGFEVFAHLHFLDPVHSLRVSMLLYLVLVVVLLNLLLKKLDLVNRKSMLVAWAFALLFVLPGGFLQREHLILSGCVLYVAMMAARLEHRHLSWRLKSIVSIIWALAVCLKPQYLVIYAMVELYCACDVYLRMEKMGSRQRFLLGLWSLIRWENIVITIIGLSYIGVVLLYFPAYFEKVVPLAEEHYQGYFKSWSYLLMMCGSIWVFTFPFIVYVRRYHINALHRLLIVVFYTSFLVYILGRAGFAYHLFVPFGVSVYFLFYSLVKQLSHFRAHYVFIFISTAVLCLFQYFSIISVMPVNYGQSVVNILTKSSDPLYPRHSKTQSVYAPLYESIKAISHENQSIMFINASMAPANFIRAHLDLKWASHFPVLWSLPNSIQENGVRDNEALALVRQNLIIDLKDKNPKILVIDDSKEKKKLPENFSFYAFLSSNPEFPVLLSQYKKVNVFTHGDTIKYDIYVRKEE